MKFVIILLLLGPVAACQKASPAPAPAGPREARSDAGAAPIKVDQQLLASGRIKLESVALGTLSGELRVAGEVRSSESGSAEAGTLVAGRVASLEVAEGAQVKRGQVLAWVDAPEVARAAAALLLARARALVAGRKRARQETLDAVSATSKNALDDARAEDEAARAELLSARTLLTSLGGAEPPSDPEARALAVRVPVRAPIAGVVAERNAVLGGAVSPDKTLFRIVADSQSSFSILARVPETVVQKPQVGATASIAARGDGSKSCSARVAGSLGGIDPETRTLAVRLAPDPSCAWLIPGSFVDVVFATATGAGSAPPGLMVSAGAVVEVHGAPTVFVAGKTPGEFSARTVQRGVADSQHVRLEAGVAAGEQVVVEGALLLKGELLRAELEGN